MRKERSKQQALAYWTCHSVYRWHFICNGNEFSFSAIAPSQEAALQVLEAEYPGTHAKFDGCTTVPCHTLEVRRAHWVGWPRGEVK